MDGKTKNWIFKITFLVIILICALFILIWTGTIRCSKIPGSCKVYWGTMSLITGKRQPSVLILYDPADTEGLGNPELLRQLLADRKNLGIHANIGNINHLTPDMLKNVSLIIVEKARKISTLKLVTFINYIGQGGRLIWIGDSGTVKDEGDNYFLNPLKQTYNGWTRIDDNNTMIRFNALIGVDYITNICDIKDCGNNIKLGKLIASENHPLVFALKKNLEVNDNFSIVKQNEINATPLQLDYGSNLFDNNGKNYGDVFPLIVTSNSNRVAYYAIPPEYFCEESDQEKYISLINNMITGMVN